jgi:hypothetical protein
MEPIAIIKLELHRILREKHVLVNTFKEENKLIM